MLSDVCFTCLAQIQDGECSCINADGSPKPPDSVKELSKNIDKKIMRIKGMGGSSE